MTPAKICRVLAAWLQPGFIYLRTGGNGTGKTLLTLKDVRELQVKEGRPVYFVEGRFTPGAVLTDEFGWKPIKFEDWEKCDPGAIILCDEVHYDLPLRSNTSAPPPHIGRLSEHRKHGFDFFMLTQHPMNIDAFVRRLVQAPGYHQHFKRILGGTDASSCLQWDSVNAACEKDGSGKSAQITRRSFPKEVYGWYESAQQHTAKVRIPKEFFTFAAAVVGICVVGYMLYGKFFPTEQPKKVETSSSAKAASSSSTPAADLTRSEPTRSDKQLTTAEYVAAYQPRITGLMHSAPAYDKLTEPKRVPVPAACVVATKPVREGGVSGCKCFTQDATPYPMPDAMCRDMVAHGAFLAFQPEGEQRQQAEPVAQQPQERPQPVPQASNGLSVIPHQPGPLKELGDGQRVSSSGADVDQARPRVPKGSPWSFTTGG